MAANLTTRDAQYAPEFLSPMNNNFPYFGKNNNKIGGEQGNQYEFFPETNYKFRGLLPGRILAGLASEPGGLTYVSIFH